MPLMSGLGFLGSTFIPTIAHAAAALTRISRAALAALASSIARNVTLRASDSCWLAIMRWPGGIALFSFS